MSSTITVHLTQRHALQDAQNRKSRLTKYIPDVSWALFGLLEGMRKRRAEQEQPHSSSSSPTPHSPTKRLRLDDLVANDSGIEPRTRDRNIA